MKVFCFVILFLIGAPAMAQDFYQQFYYEYRPNSYYHHTGNLVSVNDTLAYIRFNGPWMKDNAYFACSYQFSNDTLHLIELRESVDFNKRAEYSTASRSSDIDNFKDSVYLGCQVYYESGGQPIYDSLFFEIDGQKYLHNNQCDSYCSRIPRPNAEKFEIRVWNGQVMLDKFQISLQQEINVIRMTKDIFGSSCCAFWGEDTDELLDKIPETIKIDGQQYVLITELNHGKLFNHEFVITE